MRPVRKLYAAGAHIGGLYSSSSKVKYSGR